MPRAIELAIGRQQEGFVLRKILIQAQQVAQVQIQ